MDSPVLVWVGVPLRTFHLGWDYLKQQQKQKTPHDIPEAIHLGNVFQLLLRMRESISEGEENSNKKVIAPQGVSGGGRGRFEALWGLFRQAVPMSRTPTGCT